MLTASQSTSHALKVSCGCSFTHHDAMASAPRKAAWALLLALALGCVDASRMLKGHSSSGASCPDGLDSGNLNFFVLGDWGDASQPGQGKVARLMGSLASCFKPEFVVSTGDNFYDHGLKGPDDPRFEETFSNVFTDKGLDVPWYAVLGNHDYGDHLGGNSNDWQVRVHSCDGDRNSLKSCPAGCCYSALWQSDPALTHKDKRWQGARQGVWSQTFGGGAVEIFFLDTNPQVSDYRVKPWADAGLKGGLNARDAHDDRAALDRALSGSKADWKIVVGHHPVKSYGEHCPSGGGNCDDMAWLAPVLRKYKVAAYMAGHNHHQEFIQEDGDSVAYVVSGAGHEVNDDHKVHAHEYPGLLLSSYDLGFVAVSVDPNGNKMDIHYYADGHSSSGPVYTATLKLAK